MIRKEQRGPVAGRFITFEGGEGAGKSTQIRLFAVWLLEQGCRVKTTREPGGTAGAEEIRKLLVSGDPGRWLGRTEVLLHFAARIEHVERKIKPSLQDGAWVLCDRFADSTRAYQGYGHQLDRGMIEELYRLSLGAFAPDLTFILDLPVEEGLSRARARHATEDEDRPDEHRYERMRDGFHERVRNGFLEIAAAEPQRCVIIDATGSVDEVQARVRAEAVARLGDALKTVNATGAGEGVG